ncbi:peptidoglycan-binding domain-containing protein [Tropicibacter naphthalenivorans]|uniref:His-Xaa-Ser repeat protein HxsA n=1 Tax=Tropicibacter naphthalenivorans TaxID=441103 RepID=A0A0P1GLA5_9RHOB|nr:peptidoglycan-binding domain-containing protein [Tropicibacter naphthalenivorans]CUH76166.1 His-Xaa-Ser repeat protein HxsA [Tropicibacter naphthalenivorans]SMC39601.1 Putative peptidoglycan binding domain-containing protein [Tropicibacter naphthalenivorans]
MIRVPAPLIAMALVAACSAPEPVSRASTPEPQPVGPPPMATPSGDGGCIAHEITPAVYEQVMGEVQVIQAEIAPDGTVVRPPVYRKAPVPRIVRPRAQITFDAPCPEQLTPEFIASIQRALGARGYFSGNVTGMLDAPTTAAIRRYQSDRGLNSAQLSLETARGLGLIAVERDQIPG